MPRLTVEIRRDPPGWDGADLEQGANERQWAMVNGVLEAGSDRKRHRPIRHALGIVNCRPQGVEIANSEGVVDPFELLILCAPLCI
jgi:hypothetical protein